MARNELVPQDYCNMVVDYLIGKSSPFTVGTVTKYCIKKSKALDEGDEQQIKQIVRDTLETLHSCGYLVEFAGCYVRVWGARISNFHGFVFETSKSRVKISKEMIDRLNEIDDRTTYDSDLI